MSPLKQTLVTGRSVALPELPPTKPGVASGGGGRADTGGDNGRVFVEAASSTHQSRLVHFHVGKNCFIWNLGPQMISEQKRTSSCCVP